MQHRSATVGCRMSSAVADLGTVQALTSLARAPKQRLNVLPTVEFVRYQAGLSGAAVG